MLRVGPSATELAAVRLRIAAGATAVALATVYTVAANPHDANATFPLCPTKYLTGLDCPACGGLRLVHDAGHGDLAAMAHDNLLLLVLSPLLVAWLVRLFLASWRGETAKPMPRALAWSLLGVSVVWMVVRNLPGWPLKPA